MTTPRTTIERARQDAMAMIAAVVPDFAADPADLQRPPRPEMGDLAFACFGLAKAAKRNPADIAKGIAGKAPSGLIVSASAAGPYVNFTFDKKAFAAAVLAETLGVSSYRQMEPTGKRVMIEYGSPNTHKEIHVGHLRNFSLGLAVVNLGRAAGHEVVPVNYIGDIGAHVAKWMWYFVKTHPEGVMTEPGDEVTAFGKIYTEATRLADSDEKNKEEIAEVQRKLEAHDPDWEALWLKTRDICLRQLARIFAELGIAFERTYLESEVEGPGKELVKDLLAKGIAKEGERGAIIVDLEDEGLGIFLVLKSDGSALYSTKELALARLKAKEFAGIGESVHVVDSRQSLYFRQLFATLRRMGFDKPMVHLGYEFVTLKEGAMSSRKGNIVTYEDFRDEMKERVRQETRKRRTEWDDAKIEETAWALAEGAMKFGMLKQDNDRPIVFDMEESLSFDGFTGPYIQYAHARLSSIMAKAGENAGAVPPASDDPAEFALLRTVADLPDAVRNAAASHRPSLLAQYLFDLAQAANGFYRDVPVLAAEGDDRTRRLAVAASARVALARGLGILGIKAPDEM